MTCWYWVSSGVNCSELMIFRAGRCLIAHSPFSAAQRCHVSPTAPLGALGLQPPGPWEEGGAGW